MSCALRLQYAMPKATQVFALAVAVADLPADGQRLGVVPAAGRSCAERI